MYQHRRVIVSVIAGVLALLMIAGIIFSASAESSVVIKSRIDSLKKKEKEIAAEKEEAQAQREANESEILDVMERKDQIDQQIMLTQDSIDTKNEIIQEYNLLIAEKQNELGDAVDARDELNERYRLRIRAMEEKGSLSYWSIIFQASSFADLLDRVEMINEIARSDSRMIEQLQQAAQEIEAARQDLAGEKMEMEAAKESLAAEQAELEAQRAEADALMAELMANHEEFAALEAQYEEEREALLKQIAEEQVKYKKAVAAENSAYNGGSSNSGLSWPCAARGITSPFGRRYHPTQHVYSNHSGIDINASYGAPIYACASGTVTSATYSNVFGYHVRISHNNGFLTLYGHMTRYTVRAGQHVNKGEIIGYVGNSGWSTAAHLHLTIYRNGVLVNPLSYLPSGWYYT